MRNNQEMPKNKSMIESRESHIQPRTDYTYARTQSYLPVKLACPAAEKMIPNLKRDRIWRQTSSADTSISHRCETDSESLYRQKTIDLCYPDHSEPSIKSLKLDENIKFRIDSRKPTNIQRTKCFMCKTIFLLLLLGVCGSTLAYYFKHPDNFSRDYIKKKIKPWFHEFSPPNKIAIMQLKKELQHDMHSDIELLKNEISELKNKQKHHECPLPNAFTTDNEHVPSWFLKYNNDRTGLLDFAHESMGGEVYSIRCTKSYFNNILGLTGKKPQIVLQSNLMPGNCWPFEGSNGTVVIKLARIIEPTGFSYEHIEKSLSIYNDNAPLDFSVYAWINGSNRTLLGNFYFKWNENKLQTFIFKDIAADFRAQFYEMKIKSNWGNEKQTCLYRIRIHGRV